MMRLVKVLLVMACLVPVPAWATNYYVDNAPGHNGNDSNACTTEALPCLTIQGGIGKAEQDSSGVNDTVLIKTGTYNEQVIIEGSGSSAGPFTIKNFSGHTPHLTCGALVGCIRLNNTNSAGSSGDIISYVTIEGLEISGGRSGIRWFGADHIVIRRNYIHDICTSVPSDGGDCGAPLGSGRGTSITIDRNLIANAGAPASAWVGHWSVGLYLIGSNYVVTNNVMYDIAHYAIQGAAYPYDPVQDPSTAYAGFSDSLIANNTIAYGRKRAAMVLWYAGQSPTNNRVVNNLFYENSQETSANTGIDFEGLSTNTTIANNISYATGGTPTFAPGGGDNCSPCTFTANACNAGAGANCASTIGNPSMVNAPSTEPGSPDFSLTSASTVAINAGTTSGGTIPGNGSAPDIGAFETFGCSTAAASGNAVDLTCQMSLNVPILPATGQSAFVVKFSGTPRGTVSAVRLSDSLVRITFDGAACNSTDTMTVDYTAGNVTDSANIGGTLIQKLFSFTALAVNESNCTGGGGPPPPTGPKIVYDMNSISGTTVPDTSGFANDGTTTGSPTVVTGLIDDALDFADQVDDFITAPHGSGINPTTQSGTYCILVSPDSTSNTRTYMGTPLGSDQLFFLSTVSGTWTMGIQDSTVGTNNDFPVQSGWQFPCIEFNADTDKATLIVNAVRGTTENGTTGASIKPYTSYTFAGNLTIGKANGFGSTVSPGGVIDHFVYYSNVLTQQEMTELYESLINPSPPPNGSREQKAHQWQRPYYNGGVAESLRVVNGDAQVMRGGYVDLVVQLDCTDTNCDSFSPRVFRSLDGGATYAQVNDTCGVVCFRGDNNDPDLVSGTIECCLTGALTENDGPTNFTSAAIPNITLSQNHSITIRYKLKIDSSATVGQVIYFKVYDQNGNEMEGGYTPALGAKLTVKDYSNGGGF